MKTAMLCACVSLTVTLAGCTPLNDSGDGVCNEWMPVDGGQEFTYLTTPDNGDPPFQWTQQLLPRDSDGFYPLRSDQSEGSATLFYRCNAGDVELIRSEASAGDYSATEVYDPPWLAWPADAPEGATSWTSIVDVTVTTAGVTQTQQKTGQWTVLDANVEAVTDQGDTWPNSVIFEHTSSIRVDGNETVSTEELSITSLDGPGLVWSDVIVTVPGGSSESFTELLSVD